MKTRHAGNAPVAHMFRRRSGANTRGIQYDPGHIDQRHRYTIQARILDEGKVQFINTQAYPVITGGNPDTVEVIVNPVR